MKPLSTIDSFCLYADSPHAGMHGAFLQIYAARSGDNKLTRFKRIRRHIENSLDKSPVFRRRIERAPFELERAQWVDGSEVDLDHHVRRVTLPKPGTQAQLAEAYANIYAEAMDLSRPLWEIHVIDGLDACNNVPPNSFALVAKFHHAGVDGVTGVDITAALHSTNPRARSKPPMVRTRRAKLVDAAPDLGDWVVDGAKFYARLGKALASNIPAMSATIVKQILPKPKRTGPRVPEAPKSLLNGPISGGRTFSYLAIDLADIARIRAAVPETTVNDIYLTICGGVLRKFLSAADALPKASLVAACPVNVRTENEKGEGGNKFSLMRVPLGTDQADPMKRLIKIAAFTRAAKSSMGGRSGARKSMAWLEMIPAPLLAVVGATLRKGKVAARISPLVNLVVTNVPGPRETIYLDGYELIDVFGVPPVVDGAGLIIGATSYRNQLCIAVGACSDLVPDAEAMRQTIRAASEELLKAAMKPPRARRSSTAESAKSKKSAKPISAKSAAAKKATKARAAKPAKAVAAAKPVTQPPVQSSSKTKPGRRSTARVAVAEIKEQAATH